MAEPKQEQLDTKAARIAGELADKLLAPLDATLSTLDSVFPGIRERVAAIIDPGKIRESLNADVARSDLPPI